MRADAGQLRVRADTPLRERSSFPSPTPDLTATPGRAVSGLGSATPRGSGCAPTNASMRQISMIVLPPPTSPPSAADDPPRSPAAAQRWFADDPGSPPARRWCGCATSQQLRRGALLLAFPVCVGAARHYGTVDSLRRFSNYAAAHPVASPFLLAAVVAGAVATTVPGLSVWVAVGGMVVQPWWFAALASWVGHLIGAVANWYTFGGRPPRLRCCGMIGAGRPHAPPPAPDDDDADGDVGGQQCLTLVQRWVRGAPWWLLALLRFFPPIFGPVTAALALFGVSFHRFFVTTAIGTLPPQLVMCFYAGRFAEWLTADVFAPGSMEDMDPQPSNVAAAGIQGRLWLQAWRWGLLPPRLPPWAVPVAVPFAWIALLVGGAAFGWRGWRLPASRMWRRRPVPPRRRNSLLSLSLAP